MMPFCDLRPLLTRLFLPVQPQTEFYYFPLHSQSAAPFSPSKSTKESFIFNTAYPPHARLFFLPAQSRTEFYFLTLHASSLSRGPRLPRCITIFSVLSAAFHHAEHRVSLHAEYIQRSCPKCVAAPKRRNFPARKRYGRHTSGRRDGHTR